MIFDKSLQIKTFVTVTRIIFLFSVIRTDVDVDRPILPNDHKQS